MNLCLRPHEGNRIFFSVSKCEVAGTVIMASESTSCLYTNKASPAGDSLTRKGQPPQRLTGAESDGDPVEGSKSKMSKF